VNIRSDGSQALRAELVFSIFFSAWRFADGRIVGNFATLMALPRCSRMCSLWCGLMKSHGDDQLCLQLCFVIDEPARAG